MRAALAYPIFVVTMISAIIVAIMVFVIPRFRRIFDQLGGELPAFTRVFMHLHGLLCRNVVYLIALVIAMLGALLILSRTKRGHRFLSRAVLRVPLFGRLVSEVFVATFCTAMATLLQAGVPVLDAFDILRNMTSNDVMAAAVTKARKHLTDGCNIAVSLASAGFFPNMVVKMTQVGEESGSLTPILRKTSEQYERRISSTIDTAIGLLEPVLIVTIGIVVLVAVIALYLPVFSISDVTR
jgi:type IV pilus assembly protein PilC